MEKKIWVSIFDRGYLFRGSCKSKSLMIVYFWLVSGESVFGVEKIFLTGMYYNHCKIFLFKLVRLENNNFEWNWNMSFLFLHVLLYSTNKICELILKFDLVVSRALLFLGNDILRCQVFHLSSYCWIFGNTEVRFYFLKLWYRFNGLCFRFVPRFMLSDNRVKVLISL